MTGMFRRAPLEIFGESPRGAARLPRHRPCLPAGITLPITGLARLAGESDQPERPTGVGRVRDGDQLWAWRFCRRLSRAGDPSTSQLVQFALRFVRLAAEADGAAAPTQDFIQRQVRSRSLTQRLQRMETEADDFGGEAKFFLGFGIVVGQHSAGGMARGRKIAFGASRKWQARWPSSVSRMAGVMVIGRDILEPPCGSGLKAASER